MGRTTGVAVVTALLCASSAMAAPTTGQDPAMAVRRARLEAEALEKKRAWEGCGRIYRDTYSSHPNDPRADEVLYNAGVCFERARSVGAALAMYAQLRRRFPHSRQAQKALVRAANLHAQTASFARAAELYEEYARMYPGEKDAPSALSNAVAYRQGIGDYDRAIADTERFVRSYRRKNKREAAAALFSMAGLYQAKGQSDRAAAVLRRYLKEFGRVGGRARVVIALARIGEHEWQRSCPLAAGAGGCVRVRRKGQSVAFKAVTRNHRRAAEARRHFRRAVAEWRKLAGTRPDAGYRFRDDGQALRAAADRWHGAARFYLADASFEQMLAKKAGSAADAAAMFERAGEATPAWQVASAARVGQVLLHQGQPRRAAAAFQRCLKLSVEASHFDD
ncbi:MAG: tetratricopeptide repeat protein, partial [Deltaproteobacteria bacterium]|nr:tetratricopeptide repeat protein [Deltaproteobacteria bacterium]